jgi:hypothetical protein
MCGLRTHRTVWSTSSIRQGGKASLVTPLRYVSDTSPLVRHRAGYCLSLNDASCVGVSLVTKGPSHSRLYSLKADTELRPQRVDVEFPGFNGHVVAFFLRLQSPPD